MDTATATTTTATTADNNLPILLQDLEREYLTVRTERDELFKEKQSLQHAIQSLQEETTQIRLSLSEATSSKTVLEGQIETADVKYTSVTEQLRDVQERADRNAVENDKLRDELDKVQRSNAALQAQLDEIKVRESASTSNTLRFECERYKTECQALSQHSTYLEGEVSGLREKMASSKSEQLEKMVEMEQRLHSSSDLVFRLESDAKADQERIESYKQLVTSLQSKIAERDLDIASLSARWESEASGHANLRLMYEHKYELLDSRMREAETHLKKAREVAAESTAAIERQRLGYEEQIATLESQVNKQAALIEDRESQRARANSRMLNLIPDSESGIKLTEVYDELVTKDDELRQVKAEKAKLESSFKRVIDEMEKKAPIIAQRQKDFNAMKSKYEQIKNNYEEVLEECSHLREEAKSAEESSRRAMISSDVTRRENVALAQQVQNLLKAQLGFDIDSQDTFTNVEELQVQNQHLLQSLYKAESEVENIKNETEHKLVEANSILSDFSRLKEERLTQQEHVESLVQQRDMYRALLAKHDSVTLALEGESIEVKLSRVEAQLVEKDREVTSMNEKVSRLNAYCEGLISSNEEIRNKLLEKSSELAKTAAKLSYSEARKEQVERDLSDKNNRLENLKSRNDSLNKQNEQVHHESTKLSSQIAHLNLNMADLKSANQALSVSKSSLESTVARLNGEIKVLQDQAQQNARLLTSLQRIELHVEGDAKNRMEKLENTIAKLQETLRNSVSKSSMEDLQKQLTIREVEITSKEKEVQRLASALSDATKASDGSSGVSDIVNKLAEVEVELEDSNKHLETYKQMAKEFEALAKTLEEEKQKLEQDFAVRNAEVASQKSALMELTSSFDAEKASLLEQLTSNNSSIVALQAQISDLTESKSAVEGEKKDLRDEMIALRNDLASMTSNYDRELTLHSQCRTEFNKLKRDYSEIESGNQVSQTRVDTLQAQLSKHTSDFQTMKTGLEREILKKNSIIDDLRKNTEDINAKISFLLEQVTTNTGADEVSQDLRSVVEFQQNERRILDAEITSLRGSLEREGVNLRIVQRALDEARAELELHSKKDNEISQAVNNEQLSLLSESNAHLRESNAQLSNDLASVRLRLEESDKKLSPLQTELQVSVTKCKQYEAEIEVLKKDAEAWKSRTKQIIAKFSQIDPDEFDQLKNANIQAKALIAKANKEISGLKSSMADLQKKHEDALLKLSEVSKASEKSDEVENIKRSLLNAEKRSERLTTFLRTNKSALEQKTKEKDNLTKELDSQIKLVAQFKKEVENLKMLLKKNSAALKLNESKDIDKVAKPVKKVEAIVKSGTKSEPSPVSKSVVNVIDSPVATKIDLMVVIDQSVPALPSDGFKFAGGQSPMPALSSVPVSNPENPEQNTVKVESAESDLRARLMMKKRKLQDKILANSQKENVRTDVEEEPETKRERTASTSKDNIDVSSAQANTDLLNSSLSASSYVAEINDKPSSSPFIIDLKPPSNSSTNLSNLVFGTSKNIQLPVPKATPTAAPVAGALSTIESPSNANDTSQIEKTVEETAEIATENTTKEENCKIVALTEE